MTTILHIAIFILGAFYGQLIRHLWPRRKRWTGDRLDVWREYLEQHPVDLLDE